jgi:hypothetical protein
MKRLMFAVASAIALVGLPGVGTARADHNTAVSPPPTSESAVDFDMRLDHDGFRLGGRLPGLHGVWGAWLNGHGRPGGFTLDGRLQGDGHAYNFRFDTGVEDGGVGAKLRWWQQNVATPGSL